MSPRSRRRRAPPARTKSTARRARGSPRARAARKGFVGRDGSPVLDRYPPRDAAGGPPGPIRPPPPALATSSSFASAPPPPVGTKAADRASPLPAAQAPAATPPVGGLLSLDAPFDIDGFSQLLGEPNLRVTVPREDLPEVLRRVTDFMGFGIYVYAIRVEPAPEERLRQFVVTLERVDYSAARGAWAPFEEKGRSESPFGPGDVRP